MGSYIVIKNTEKAMSDLKRIYDKHFKINKDQFRNDFGNINTFDEIFEIYNKKQNTLILKIGVMYEEFYTKEFRDDVKSYIEKNNLKMGEY